jgi:hypothetical protein
MRYLSAQDLCQLANVKHPRRADWAKKQLVRQAPRGGKYGEVDAVETVCFGFLVRELDFEDAALVWRGGLREAVRDALMSPGEYLVVIDLQQRRGGLARSRAAVGALLEERHPCVLLDLTNVVDAARDTCTRLREQRGAATSVAPAALRGAPRPAGRA